MVDIDPKTYKDDDGNEVKAVPAEQVEAALKEKEEAYGTEKTKLESDLAEATKKFEEADEKAGDFKELREAKEALEKGKVDMETKHAEEIATIKGGEMVKHKDKLIEAFADKDEELKEKIKFHLEKNLSAMPESTVEEFDEKVKQAFTLATGTRDEDKITSVMNSFGVSGGDVGASGKFSDELQEVGKKGFGLTDDDFKRAEEAGEI